MRIKTKDWKRVTFSLDKEVAQKLKELSKFEGLDQSAFVEFLISNWNEGLDPEIKLNNLLKDREELIKKTNYLEERIKTVSNNMSEINIWKKEKNKKKDKAIEIIRKLILSDDLPQAERVSKTWQAITGISALDLLIEAKEEITKTGV